MKKLTQFCLAQNIALIIFCMFLFFLSVKDASIIFLSLTLVNILTEVIFLWYKKTDIKQQ